MSKDSKQPQSGQSQENRPQQQTEPVEYGRQGRWTGYGEKGRTGSGTIANPIPPQGGSGTAPVQGTSNQSQSSTQPTQQGQTNQGKE